MCERALAYMLIISVWISDKGVKQADLHCDRHRQIVVAYYYHSFIVSSKYQSRTLRCIHEGFEERSVSQLD